MEQNLNQERIKSIYQMLMEMAAGNFDFRIERSGQDDELESLIVLVNMVAEEMRSSIFHRGFVSPHFSYQYLVQTTFILNKDFIIESYNAEVLNLLAISPEKLYKVDFATLLDDDSKNAWRLFTGIILRDNNFHKTLQFTFKTGSNLIIPSFCTISRLLHSTKILISSVTIVVQESASNNSVVLNSSTETEIIEQKHDAKLLKQVYDYILDHLETPLPSIKELSQIFGTNEFKLKEGFRHFFSTSIYQFYNEERLKRAHLLIQTTALPFKSIAFMCGFNNYPNFSKAFKKRFNYPPKIISRGKDT